MTAPSKPGFAAGVCAVLGITMILLATLLGYAAHSIFDERGFSTRVAASLDDPRVAQYVAEQMADAVISAKPDLLGLRPVLIGVARGIVSLAPARAAIRRSARELHHAIFSGSGVHIAVTVQDIGAVLESAVATQPGLAGKIPPQLSAQLMKLDSLPAGERMVKLARLANRVRAATLALGLLGVLLCAAGVWLSREKRRTILHIGTGLAALGLVLAIVGRFGPSFFGLLVHPPTMAPMVAGVGATFLAGLQLWGAGLGFAGLVLAAASASLLERIPLRAWGDTAWGWIAGPQPRMRLRLARGCVGAAIGAAMVLWPLPALTVACWLCGLLLAFAGLREGFVAALHLLPELDRSKAAGRAAPNAAPRTSAFVMVGAVAAVLLAVAGWVVLRPQPEAEGPPGTAVCNGSAALCDRTLDQVVFPTTHNSMGGADDSKWMFPNQTAGIRRQLEDGVRGLMIDLHYARPVGDRVKTDLADEKAAVAKYESSVGKEGLAAALRIRDRLTGVNEGERDVYLCHGFCELGAQRLVPVLRDVREFLVANPGEVLIIVIQDEGVSPADIERCFQESGLIGFVYRGPARPPWPTLRDMVESDQRVLVVTENVSAGVDWCHPAFEVMQETPYAFHDPSEFSNRPNRGGTSGSLLLLNHWIETTPMPKPSNAAIVNAHDALLARIRACTRARRRVPNLVAVDLYGVGDLIQVVREVNEEPIGKLPAGPRRR